MGKAAHNSGRSARVGRVLDFLAHGGGFDRAIVLVIAAAMAGVWILTIERVGFEESQATAAAFRQTTNLAIAMEAHVAGTLEDIELTLQRTIDAYERDGHQPAKELRELFDDLPTSSKLYKVFAIADKRGDVVFANTTFQATNLGERDYFQFHQRNAGAQVFIGIPVVGRLSGKRIVPVTRRIDNADGSFGGVVIAAIDPEYFTNFYRRIDVGENGLIGLVGLDGIARATRVGDRVEYGKDLQNTTLFEELRTRPNGAFLGRGTSDGIRRYVSYRTLAGHPLAVQVGFSAGDVLADFANRKSIYYTMSCLATGGLVLVGIGFIAAAHRQRRANDELLRNEARFRATFDQAAIGMVHVDLDGRFLRANRKFCEMHGYSEAELRQLTIREITHPDDCGKIERFRANLVDDPQSDEPRVVEKRNVRKDGSTLWVSIAVALVHDNDGEPQYFATMTQDISARKEAEERYRATFDQTAVGVAVTTLDGRFLQVNAKLAEILGYAPAELQQTSVLDHVVPEQLEAARESRRVLDAERQQLSVFEFECVRKDGSRAWISRSLAPVCDASGRTEYCIAIVQDITERKRAEAALQQSNELFEQLVQHIPEAFWIVDVERNELVYLSPAYEQLCGVRFDSLEAASRGWLETLHLEDRDRAIVAARNLKSQVVDQRFRVVRPDGAIRWVHVRGFPVRDASGNVYRVAGTLEDMTERQRLVDRLQYQAHYDALTGLPNRVLCLDRLKQTLSQAKRKQWLGAVLYVDLDRFKLVNDTLGHVFGDQLLQQVSRRLSACVRTTDTVGRLGGDEFAIVLSELAQSQDAGLVAQKVLDALAKPFDLDGHEVFVTSSIGIATYPGDGDDAEMLLKNADAAMFSAKDLGKNNYQFYTAAMNERALERLLLESNLRRALERDEFVLHLQPKASVDSGVIVGCEALLRWQVPGNGLVAPAQFIPLLEESGLIVSVGEWVVRSACAQLRAWLDAGIEPVPVAVNLSAKQFKHHDFCAMVDRALRDFKIAATLLEFEITESAAMHDAESAIITLGRLKGLGVRMSIDDFGTGYSSLSYLKQFPVDALKIDRSFVKDLPDDADDAAIARAVIRLAHSLGLEVVAEGVETQTQLAFLADNGCDLAQGYYLSRPLPPAQFAQLLSQRRRLPPPRISAEIPLAEQSVAGN